MPLSNSPSSSTSKKSIFQKLFGKVRGAVMALGILSVPMAVHAKNSNTPNSPTLEERLALAQKMNLEGIKSYQELENTIEFTWSQLKDTPGAPEHIRDKYGHITTEGLTWIESELPKEYHRRVQKYKNIERELEKMDKKDPNWGAWEYSLVSLGALLVGLVGYRLGKFSQKELDKLKKEHEIAHDEATKHMQKRVIAEGKNAELEAKIAAMKKAQKMGGRTGEIVDAEVVETKSSDDILPSPEMPEWLQDTFLAGEKFYTISKPLIDDISSDTPSEEAQNLQKSIQKISDTTGTNNEKARRLNAMSENLISYARLKRMPEDTIGKLLRELERSFQGKEFSFSYRPIIGQDFDNTKMTRIGEVTSGAKIKVTKVLSLTVIGPNTHPQSATKTMTYEFAKVNC